MNVSISKSLSKLPTIDYTKIKQLQGNLKDLNEKNYEKIRNSLTEFGFIVPLFIWINGNEYFTVDGHQRLRFFNKEKVVNEKGTKEFPYVEIEAENVQEAKKKLLVISSQYGKMTQEGLDEFTFDLDDSWLKQTTFFDALPNFDFNLVEPEAEEDDFDVPEGGIETDIVLGDLFEIGEHRLLCGDSTQTDTFEKLMQGELADMVVTDPPYNVALGMETKEQAKARNRRTDGLVIKNDKMSNGDFYQFLYDFYTALSTVVKKGGAIYVWYASSEVVNFVTAMVDAGWLYKQELIWNKTSMIMGRQDYQWKHEPCLYGWLDGGSHNWNSDRKQTTIIDFDKPQRNGEHPTMKPVGLIAYQIGNSSKNGDIVIDAFGGSGTTMVACEQLKRKARVIEYDPKYCQVIIDRMKKLVPTLVIKRNGIKIN